MILSANNRIHCSDDPEIDENGNEVLMPLATRKRIRRLIYATVDDHAPAAEEPLAYEVVEGEEGEISLRVLDQATLRKLAGFEEHEELPDYDGLVA